MQVVFEFIELMDSDEFQPFSQSNITDSPDTIQSLNSIGFRSQTPTNGMISSSFQYQPTFPPFSSQSQQHYSQNFSYQDIALTKARLHVSCDADTGVGQKFETLWSRILQVWRENMGEFDRTRDSNALECRWSRLQTAINKFHGCYERLERMKKSGTNLDDVKGAALRTFQDTNNNQAFKHEECWEICRQNAKWCTQHLTKQDGHKKRKCSIDSSNENPPTSNQTQSDPISIPDSNENVCSETKVDELDNTNHEGVARPTVGRKGVKDQKKRLVAEKGVVDALGNLQTSLEKQFDLNRVELDLKKEREKKEYDLREKIFNAEIELKKSNHVMKQKALKRQEEERILEKDLSKLSPNVRRKYEIMQSRILKEWEKDGYFGDVSSNDDISL
ncbi:hypothetical protein OROMI_026663 [Orobanche minor]